jgi:excisionase family DNA binding protein
MKEKDKPSENVDLTVMLESARSLQSAENHHWGLLTKAAQNEDIAAFKAHKEQLRYIGRSYLEIINTLHSIIVEGRRPVHEALFKREEAAHYLGITVGTLAAWHHNRTHMLPFTKIGKRCFYKKEDLDALLSKVTRPGKYCA